MQVTLASKPARRCSFFAARLMTFGLAPIDEDRRVSEAEAQYAS